ncbi:MAG: hypothetical protein QOG32_1020, partial [Chloroflexota bacterium]|nr:hypothetical protein [Chloroflexota bacterium]
MSGPLDRRTTILAIDSATTRVVVAL